MHDAPKRDLVLVPNWVPPAVAEYITKLIEEQSQSPAKLVILQRLLTDARMREIWGTLLEKDRTTGRFRYPAQYTDSAFLDEKQKQDKCCALIIYIVFRAAVSQQVQLRQVDIDAECQRLRQCADQIRNAIAAAQQHGILSDSMSVFGQASLGERDRQASLLSRLNVAVTLTGDGQSFADLGYSHPDHGPAWFANGGHFQIDYSPLFSEIAKRFERKANEISDDWSGQSAARNVGDMRYKFIAMGLCRTFEKYFGQSLDGTAANMAAVALGLETPNVAAARKAEQRRRKPQ